MPAKDLNALAHKALAYIRQQAMFAPGERVGVAVSGGADSVALLRLLLVLRGELGLVLRVAHFDHKIRVPESESDAQFVSALATQFDLPCESGNGDAPAQARSAGQSLENAARTLRYAFFHSLVASGVVDKVATAHTLDDQAETVLMKLLRGAGTRGLAGIYPAITEPQSGRVVIVRPLLGARRAEIEAYLQGLQQGWREDASNRDVKHTRNRIRHELLPKLLQEWNPAVAKLLADLAETARAEEEYWNGLVRVLLPALYNQTDDAIRVEALLAHPVAVQRRLLRAAAEKAGLRLNFEHVEALRRLAGSRATQQPKTQMVEGGAGELRKIAGQAELRLVHRCPSIKDIKKGGTP